jgi:hypothetical protein
LTLLGKVNVNPRGDGPSGSKVAVIAVIIVVLIVVMLVVLWLAGVFRGAVTTHGYILQLPVQYPL